LNLAHDKCGCHQGQKRRSERICYSFYWPSLKADVIKHCNSCEPCLQCAIRVADCVPIRYIERPDLPGAYLMMDVIGPIDPPSAQGHTYRLCIIVVCIGWQSVYLLTCRICMRMLCDLFSMLGIASVISSDNATNLSSKGWLKNVYNTWDVLQVFRVQDIPNVKSVLIRVSSVYCIMLFVKTHANGINAFHF